MKHQNDRRLDERAAAAPAEPPPRPGLDRLAPGEIAEFRRPGWNRNWFLALLLVAATFLAYQPVWSAGFIWDDDLLLTGNPLIAAADGLRGIWWSTELPDYFPMTSTVLWLEWRLWGRHPLGYHLVNVLLHALSAVLWWRVLARLKIPGAWLAAAIFALHPVNVESVAWISEIKNTLAMVFYVSALLAYVRFEDAGKHRTSNDSADSCPVRRSASDVQCSMFPCDWHWYGLALAAFVLSLLSKTAGAPLPVVLWGLAWWRRGRLAWRDLWRSIPFFAIAALLALVTIWFQYHRAIGSTVVRTDDFWSRLATAGWAIWFYLYKALLPLNLAFIYPRWQVDTAKVLAWAPGCLFAAGLLVCWIYRRRGGKAWLFGLGYFAVMLLPVLGFLNISFMRYSLVADRWLYFAMMGPIALVAAGIARGLNDPKRSGQGSNFKSALCTPRSAIILALLLTLGALTWRQSRMYHGPETLWRGTIARNPDCALAHTDLGNVLVQRGRVDEAIAEYQKALEIQPESELAHYNYGYFLLQSGKADEAIFHFQKALAIQPGSVPLHYHLGNALAEKGRIEEAATHFQKALEMEPGYAEIRNRLGDILLRTGQVDEAMAQFQKALQIQPHYPHALNNLGIALFQKGKTAEAVAHFRQVLAIQPDFVEARINLGKALLHEGRASEAVAQYRAALRLQPEDTATLADLAWVLATWPEASVRNGTEAMGLAQKANQIAINPDPLILRTLAAAQAENGQFNEAIAIARQAAQLADARSDALLAEELRSQIKLYESALPFREGAKSE